MKNYTRNELTSSYWWLVFHRRWAESGETWHWTSTTRRWCSVWSHSYWHSWCTAERWRQACAKEHRRGKCAATSSSDARQTLSLFPFHDEKFNHSFLSPPHTIYLDDDDELIDDVYLDVLCMSASSLNNKYITASETITLHLSSKITNSSEWVLGKVEHRASNLHARVVRRFEWSSVVTLKCFQLSHVNDFRSCQLESRLRAHARLYTFCVTSLLFVVVIIENTSSFRHQDYKTFMRLHFWESFWAPNRCVARHCCPSSRPGSW